MSAPPVPPISSMEQRGINQLLSLLKQAENTPNIITLEEFHRFAPLYAKPKSSEDLPEHNTTLRMLADAFQTRINPYKPTHVVRSRHDGTVLLRLPQMLIPLKSLSPTDANTAAVNLNYNYRHSAMPRIWSTAQNIMTRALCQEQQSPDQVQRIAQVTKETINIMRELDNTYGRARPVTTTIASVGAILSADKFDDL